MPLTRTLESIRYNIMVRIPGTKDRANTDLAARKRELERRLRADGWSRAGAKTEVTRRLGHARP